MSKVLIIVDMQNDFITGSLGTEEAKKILPSVVKKAEEYQKNGCLIFFTKDTHGDDYLETQEGEKLPIKHCIKGERGFKIQKKLASFVTRKNCFEKDTFGSKKLADKLLELNSDRNIEEIEICGLCTDICVISNALMIKAYLPEVKITVDQNCCAGVTPESHKTALDAMKACQINIK